MKTSKSIGPSIIVNMGLPSVPTYDQIKALEEAMKIAFEDVDLPPINHYKADGVYARELYLQKGARLVGKMHAKDHFFILLHGEIICWTDLGMVHMKAPRMVTTTKGTKRVIGAITNARMITFHGSQFDSINDIENDIIVPEDNERNFLIEHKRLTQDGSK